MIIISQGSDLMYLAVYKDGGRWYMEVRRENDDWWCDLVGDYRTQEEALKQAKKMKMEVEVA